MKRMFLAAAACAAAVLNLAGCGERTTSSSESTGSSSGTSSTVSTVSLTSLDTESAIERSSVIEGDWRWADVTVDGVDGAEILEYLGNDDAVLMPSSLGGKEVLLINDDCFRCNGDFTSISIPMEIATKYRFAFDCCPNLREVTLLGEIENSGGIAFSF